MNQAEYYKTPFTGGEIARLDMQIGDDESKPVTLPHRIARKLLSQATLYAVGQKKGTFQ